MGEHMSFLKSKLLFYNYLFIVFFAHSFVKSETVLPDSKFTDELIQLILKGNLSAVIELSNKVSKKDTILLKEFINNKDKTGWFALAISADKGYLELTKELLKMGANVNLQMEFGWSALSYASMRCYLEVVKELIQHKANVNIQTAQGWTPLMLSVDKCNLEISKLLIAHGANVNLQNNFGWTALLIAVFKGDLELTKEILKCKDINIDITNNDGDCAINIAVDKGFVDVIQELLKHNPNLTLKNRLGRDAIASAFFRGFDNIRNLLNDYTNNKKLATTK